MLDSLRKEMEAGIQSVLAGKTEEFETDSPIFPSLVEKYLAHLGWKKGELDTNGWQYDWWLPFTLAERSFTASGSGYYGGFRFGKTEV